MIFNVNVGAMHTISQDELADILQENDTERLYDFYCG